MDINLKRIEWLHVRLYFINLGLRFVRIYLFICGLFTDSAISSGYILSNHWRLMNNELGKKCDGKRPWPIWDSAIAFAWTGYGRTKHFRIVLPLCELIHLWWFEWGMVGKFWVINTDKCGKWLRPILISYPHTSMYSIIYSSLSNTANNYIPSNDGTIRNNQLGSMWKEVVVD
jgi:hypothetical protein